MADERKDRLEVTDEELIEDDEYNTQEDDVQFVTITTDDGEEMEFVEIANLSLDGRDFTILQPTEPIDDMEEDDVLVFEILHDEKGEEYVELVEDDDLLDKVTEAYYQDNGEDEE